MTQTARVRRVISQNQVELSILRESACGHDCSSCGGCSMSEKREVLVVANDPFGVKQGDTVVVESSTQKLLGIAVLVYLLPVFLFFAGYFFMSGIVHQSEAISSATAVAGFVLGILAAIAYNRKEKKRGSVVFTVTSVKG